MEPQFMAQIHSLKGMISRLSSTGDTLSEIQLDGGVDQYGYAKVTGALDLHDIKRSAEINRDVMEGKIKARPAAGPHR